MMMIMMIAPERIEEAKGRVVEPPPSTASCNGHLRLQT